MAVLSSNVSAAEGRTCLSLYNETICLPLIKVATQKKQKLGSDSEEEWGGDGVQAHSSSDLEIDVISAEPKKTVQGKGRAPKGAGTKPAKAVMLAVKVMAVP